MKCLLFLMVAFVLASGARAQEGVVVSYTNLSQNGRDNLDSVTAGLRRLGVPYDSIDRNTRVNDTIDYRGWCTLIWSPGNSEDQMSESAFDAKNIAAVQRFLDGAGINSKKSLIVAGQNIARRLSAAPGSSIDTFFLHSELHVQYVADAPTESNYDGQVCGSQPTHWKFPESLRSSSPDVVRPAESTPRVGPRVNAMAYYYLAHGAIPSDSGAGVSYYDPLVNVVFYSFDWSNAIQTNPSEAGYLTSGTTRILSAALAFATSHGYNACKTSVVAGEEQDFDLTLYPNPTSRYLNCILQLFEPSLVTIQIIDIEGKIVLQAIADRSYDVGNVKLSIDLSNLPADSYFSEVIIKNTDGKITRSTQKIVVDR
jgi:hypothetical protein